MVSAGRRTKGVHKLHRLTCQWTVVSQQLVTYREENRKHKKREGQYYH